MVLLVPVIISATACSTGGVVRAHDWDLARPPEAAALTLTVWIGSSSCNRYDSVSVAESPSQVRIEAKVHTINTEMCPADLPEQGGRGPPRGTTG